MAKHSNQNKFSKHHYMPILALIEIVFLEVYWFSLDYAVVFAPPTLGVPLTDTYNFSLIIAIILATIILAVTIVENNSLFKIFAIVNVLSALGEALAGNAFNASGFNNLPIGDASAIGFILALASASFILFYAIRK